ncbi:MAG TPA: YCF48-related protein [Chitinophagaceae bacterium]|nr:oxidoreductase [Chitinophagaceae bacterium]MCC6634362.1 oxidoreductase [Chitinophagaceae bacterium]HMZ46372.1 YCF48-related protein [Chitinophagaceae bacterium]HNE92745.1 YCF48-related protein [Chitinophagaceae bacterium]HNJ58455.1 YCF48-related protein [Chitinophagaceae bacterium]
MKNKILFSLIFTLYLSNVFAQKKGVQILNTGAPIQVSFRGMSVADENTVWISGNNGTVGKTTDAGKTWQWTRVKNFEQNDFRDIHAFDSNNAIIMAVGNPAYILKTKDGGKSWYTVFSRNMEGMFLDAMDFLDNTTGVCIGDPISVGNSGRRFFFIIKTIDGGETWEQEPLYKMPPAQEAGEAIFAASGTNIAMLQHPDFEYAFATGGTVSNIYFIGREGKQNKGAQIPINQGIETTGTFSLATDGKKKFYCIGGDYKLPNSTYDNFYWSTDVGKKWASPNTAPPYGYRSCLRIIDKETMIACGLNGVDISKDGGDDWKNISKEGFNVCMVSAKNKMVFLAGDRGKVGIYYY